MMKVRQKFKKNEQIRNAIRYKDDKSRGPDNCYENFEFEKSCSEKCLLIIIALEIVPTTG